MGRRLKVFASEIQKGKTRNNTFYVLCFCFLLHFPANHEERRGNKKNGK